MKPNTNPKPFCLAPWVHTHIDVKGNRSLCCRAQKSMMSNSKVPINDFWNSIEMKQARLDMLANKPDPEVCSACLDNQDSSELPKDQYEKSGELIDQLMSNTAKDGTYEILPESYDYRISNKCNLACRMCNAESSSRIEDSLLKTSISQQYEVELLQKKKYLNTHFIFPELKELILKGIAKKLSFASGEAFIQKDHRELLELCIKNDLAKSISLHYNTNLAFSTPLLKKTLDKLGDFTAVEILISMDAIGKTAEFIRDGISWSLFCKNLEMITQYNNKFKISFAITFTIPTLLNIFPLLKFLYLQRFPYIVSLCHDKGTSALHSPLILDKKTLNKLLDNAEIKISFFKNKEFFKPFMSIFNQLRDANQTSYNQFTLISLFEKNEELNRSFERSKLIDYYLSFKELEGWLKNLDSTSPRTQSSSTD